MQNIAIIETKQITVCTEAVNIVENWRQVKYIMFWRDKKNRKTGNFIFLNGECRIMFILYNKDRENKIMARAERTVWEGGRGRGAGRGGGKGILYDWIISPHHLVRHKCVHLFVYSVLLCTYRYKIIHKLYIQYSTMSTFLYKWKGLHCMSLANKGCCLPPSPPLAFAEAGSNPHCKSKR